jgi:hypothetical protein
MSPIQPNFEDLAARVTRVEVQNRRWKLATGLLGLVAISFVVMGAKPADRLEPPVIRARVVEAEDFVVKDQNGHVYARLTVNLLRKRLGERALGQLSPAELEFYDANGDLALTVPGTPGILPAK